jgi:hypothetical protein
MHLIPDTADVEDDVILAVTLDGALELPDHGTTSSFRDGP